MNGDDEEDLPLLPYADTSGWSGSEMSRERAERNDGDGTTEKHQSLTLRVIDERREHGVTWKELSRLTGWHHGSASGVLSVLHLEGRIARVLGDSRDRCSVYVSPRWLDGRENAPRRKPKAWALVDAAEELASEFAAEGHAECADRLRERFGL